MSSAFLDTSYLLALELKNDQNHAVAVDHWRRVSASALSLVTTSYVFDETVTFFNSRGYHSKAVEIGSALLHSPSVRLVLVYQLLFREAWTYFQQHPDKTYSLTDCVSFMVLRKLGMDTVFAFDRHFIQAGFKTEP